ncbi:MAG: ABC transporter ATP-binding protein [Fimbriimonadaceae bacterium]
MSSKSTAISVRGLSKEYRITHQEDRVSSLGEAITQRVRNPLMRRRVEVFRALDDVSFDVEQGDVLGIIGRNGAGKSTLLKILSRITEPTRGEVRMRGRVASLLEVGTGFHPELTGRENIYLNGAILGMRRREIARQFDAIIDFAETEKFLDTPVKRYSSGMYVRLAFAVAAHLDPEILIVDEVLSVGDVQFQNKCLGKLQAVSGREGRTVLFVSHNLSAVAALCGRALLLGAGSVGCLGTPSEVLGHYSALREAARVGRPVGVTAAQGAIITAATAGKATYAPAEPKVIRAHIETAAALDASWFFSGLVVDELDNVACQFDSRLLGQWFRPGDAADLAVTLRAPWLKPGEYAAHLYACVEGRVVDEYRSACRFSVSHDLPFSGACDPGAVRLAPVLTDFTIEAGGA